MSSDLSASAMILFKRRAPVNGYQTTLMPCVTCISTSRAHRTAKAVVAVPEFRRDAAARGNASDFDLMPPGPASRCSPRSGRRALWIARRRGGVVAVVEPIRAPLVHVFRDVMKSETVRRPLTDSLRTIQPESRVIRLKLGHLIAPGV